VIARHQAMLPQILAGLHPTSRIQPLADQSLFVRASINGADSRRRDCRLPTGLMI